MKKTNTAQDFMQQCNQPKVGLQLKQASATTYWPDSISGEENFSLYSSSDDGMFVLFHLN